MLGDRNGQELINSFALVTYIPNPLGKFLDDLRRELVPGCVPHAHVTILPPRRLSAAPEAAIETIRSLIGDFAPFEIEAGPVQVFAETNVVYLGIGRGQQDLLDMHPAFNVGPLYYQEPYPYHPHITLAQDLTPQQSVDLASLARRRWREFRHSRAFTAEALVFVRSTNGKLWVDLAQFQLDQAPSIRR
jgi:2'-5' RNA ligase